MLTIQINDEELREALKAEARRAILSVARADIQAIIASEIRKKLRPHLEDVLEGDAAFRQKIRSDIVSFVAPQILSDERAAVHERIEMAFNDRIMGQATAWLTDQVEILVREEVRALLSNAAAGGSHA